jgi:hypothetical protein
LLLYCLLHSTKLEKPVADTTFSLQVFNKGNIPVASEKGNTLYVLQYDTFPPLMIYSAYGTKEEIFRSTS